MDWEKWETDERMQLILIAIVESANGARSVLTSTNKIRRATGLSNFKVRATLQALRREGVIAMRVEIYGTQITLLRQIAIVEREMENSGRA